MHARGERGRFEDCGLDLRELAVACEELRTRRERSGELDGMNFTTEMETDTGKTYVYLLESPPISFS